MSSATGASGVLAGLIERAALRSPGSRSPVQVRDGRVVSDSGRDFGSLSGPLDFLGEHEETIDARGVPQAEIERVRSHLGLPAGSEIDADIARAIALTGTRFGQAHLSAEARILAERFRIPGFDVGRAAAGAATLAGRMTAGLAKVFGSGGVARLEHISNTVGSRLTAGREVYRSVRVRNAGGALASSPRSGVEARWFRPDGTPLPESTLATALPVDLEAGREITLILRIFAPATPGRYTLQFVLPASRDAQPFLALEVDAIVCDLPVFDYAFFPAVLDYESDHRVAVQELDAYLRERAHGRKLDVLEIGGGVHPTGFALANQGHRVLATDISHSQCILGTLYFRHREPGVNETLAFLSCDGTDLPFADDAFDGVMFFAAFHHFADPRAALAEVKRVVKPGGFIFIGCDNCGPEPADATYLEELRRGINEQVFTLPEYAELFREANVRVARARIDSHSIKVVLET